MRPGPTLQIIFLLATILTQMVAPANAFQSSGDGAGVFTTVEDRGLGAEAMLASSTGAFLMHDALDGQRGETFISLDTLMIGCTAGAAAGALAIALPVVTVASTGIGIPASATAIASTAGIGCAVGMVSGLAAMGTAWGYNFISRFSGMPARHEVR